MVQLLNQFQELLGDKKEYFSFCLLDNGSMTHYQKDKEFNVASSYKVYILGELLRQYDEGKLSLEETLTLTEDVRIFDSSYTENMENGIALTIHELANAMMGYSDNTATEMLQSHLGIDNIRSLLRQKEIFQTRFPDKLKSLMDITSNITSIDSYLASTLYRGELGIISTANDLARFYQLLWSKSIFSKSESLKKMKEILSIEDRQQNIPWPEGVSCYRKSGNIDLEHYYGFSLAGIFQKEEAYIPFALCLNCSHEENINDMLYLFKKSFGLMKEHILTNLELGNKNASI
jgi:hypothetical protein